MLLAMKATRILQVAVSCNEVLRVYSYIYIHVVLSGYNESFDFTQFFPF